jgi:hypothetical protein
VSLADIDVFTVPRAIANKTEDSLRRAGREGFELFVLWSGVIDGQTFTVRTPHVPRQTSYRLESGLVVRVEGEALHKLNRWLFDHDELLAVQVHAHPTDAFHSDTDDAYPIVTARGGLSIVAADFCRDGLFTAETALFRLSETGWRAAASDLVTVT